VELEEFRGHAQQFANWMADYLLTIENRPVRSQSQPGDIIAQLPATIPDKGEAIDEIFDDFKSIILPGITHWQHPRFFAYFPANSSPPSILAEMLTATLASQCMLWETSPASNELETRMMEWLRDLLGLPGEFTGSIQDSGSSSTLCALIAARERASGGMASKSGLFGSPRLIVYTSSEAHSSVLKGATIAGIGSDNVRLVEVDDDYAMKTDQLADMIRMDKAAGYKPACIVASLGATGIGSIDPLAPIGQIARQEGIFLHVDAAWAGSALILPENRRFLDGIDHVDSFVFNPHKWLFTNVDCSAFYMRNPQELAQALAVTPTYLESPIGEGMAEYRDWSVALGRRFRALKLWFVLRSYGAETLRRMIRDHIRWTDELANEIRLEADFELTTKPRFALLSFRYRPQTIETEEDLENLNEELLRKINDDGRIYLTKTRAHGKLVIRFAIGQTYTEHHHVAEGWSVIKETARSLLK